MISWKTKINEIKVGDIVILESDKNIAERATKYVVLEKEKTFICQLQLYTDSAVIFDGNYALSMFIKVLE